MEKNLKRLYEFGPFRLDAEEQLLLREGEAVPLTPKAFDLLLALVERQGRLLEKKELLETVWPDSFVEESNLADNIFKLRKALGEGGSGQQFIETVPKRGYRFVAAVEVINGERATPIAAVPLAISISIEEDGRAATSHETAVPPPAPKIESSINRSHRRRAIILALTGVVIVATVVWFSFKRPPTLTSQDTILLADVENKTGDEIFDGALKAGLAIQLEQSRSLRLFPEARMRQTLRQMERPSDTRVTAEIAQEMCERQNLKAFIAGSIAPLGSHYVITLEAIRGRNGESLARAQVEAESKEKVLQALSQAATQLCGQLDQSLSSIQQSGKPLLQITTPDLRVFKAYSECSDLASMGRFVEALPFAKHAVELDPQFAGAYDLLALICYVAGQPEEAAEYERKALQLVEERAARQPDQVSELGKINTLVWYHLLTTGNQSKQLENLLLRRQMAPQFAPAHIDLGLSYRLSGQFEQAIPSYQEAIRLNPNFAAPYRGLAEALMRLNRFAEAKDTLTQALRLKLEFTEYHTQLYQLAFIGEDAAGMKQQLDWAQGKPDEYVAFDWQTGAAAFAGQWRKAQDFSRRAIELAARGDNRELATRYATEQALRGAVFGDCRQVKADVAQGLKLERGRISLPRAALALALCGETSQAKPLIDEMGRRYPEDTLINSIWLPTIRAAMSLQRGIPGSGATQAIKQLEITSRYEAAAEFWPQYLRGQAYLKRGKGAEAAVEFQKIKDHRGYAPLSPLYPLAHLGLARAAALTGNTAQSRKAYEDFLAAWKEADANLPVLNAAKKEYQRALTVSSQAAASPQRSAVRVIGASSGPVPNSGRNPVALRPRDFAASARVRAGHKHRPVAASTQWSA